VLDAVAALELDEKTRVVEIAGMVATPEPNSTCSTI
jgi:hypothetical protein